MYAKTCPELTLPTAKNSPECRHLRQGYGHTRTLLTHQLSPTMAKMGSACAQEAAACSRSPRGAFGNAPRPSRGPRHASQALTRARGCLPGTGTTRPTMAKKWQCVCVASARTLVLTLTRRSETLSGPHEVHGRTSGAQQGKISMLEC